MEDELEVKKREDFFVIYVLFFVINLVFIIVESYNFGDRDVLWKGIFKGVVGKVSDVWLGLGWIRDVVGGGLRGYVSRFFKDESLDMVISGYFSFSIVMLVYLFVVVMSLVVVGKVFSWKVKLEEYVNGVLKEWDFGEIGLFGLNGSVEGSEMYFIGVRVELILF